MEASYLVLLCSLQSLLHHPAISCPRSAHSEIDPGPNLLYFHLGYFGPTPFGDQPPDAHLNLRLRPTTVVAFTLLPHKEADQELQPFDVHLAHFRPLKEVGKHAFCQHILRTT